MTSLIILLDSTAPPNTFSVKSVFVGAVMRAACWCLALL